MPEIPNPQTFTVIDGVTSVVERRINEIARMGPMAIRAAFPLTHTMAGRQTVMVIVELLPLEEK